MGDGTLHVHWPDRQAEIEVHHHPTDSLMVCEDCGESCAGDVNEIAAFVIEHTKRHTNTDG